MDSIKVREYGISFADFSEAVSNLEVSEVRVPKFFIPNWPRLPGGLEIAVERDDIVYPERLTGSGLLRLSKISGRILFAIDPMGAIVVRTAIAQVSDKAFSSVSSDDLDRLTVLLLFQQCREELFPRVLARFRNHREVFEEVKKAFEPFVPSSVAEELARQEQEANKQAGNVSGRRDTQRNPI